MEQNTVEQLQPTGTLSTFLWGNTAYIRNQVLDTDFVRGIKAGTLDPVKFGGFGIQDSIYLYKQQLNLQESTIKAILYPGQYAYLRSQINLYKKMYEEEFKKWHIKQPDEIVLDTALQKYTDFEKDIAFKRPSICFLVAICPCLRLWPWIGQQIAGADHGVYTAWAKDNFNPNDVDYVEVDALIDEAYSSGQIDLSTAYDIYRTCMEGELNFFKSV